MKKLHHANNNHKKTGQSRLQTENVTRDNVIMIKVSIHQKAITIINMLRTTGQKINKETEDLNNTINQLDLIDIYRILHPITEYTFYQVAWNIHQDRLYGRP